eukprot:TRINITY_DN14064_c0_g1_i2.p1 TRINITY_DN14064_c0_g1~~TRINITY_DN14064_c0_g1_i2.p1  ORF type:complete len:506 (-),score=92.59 TRINITY_DN14064_c0_g1_i2:180-1697(-)
MLPSPTATVQPPLTPEGSPLSSLIFDDLNWLPNSPHPLQHQLPNPPSSNQNTKCDGDCGFFFSLPLLSPSQSDCTTDANSADSNTEPFHGSLSLPQHSQQGFSPSEPSNPPSPPTPSSMALLTFEQVKPAPVPQIRVNVPMTTKFIIESFDPINSKLNSSKQARKKTNRACVYCQRSHACCDSFRPCSKCVARGIGHLCKDREPKKTKKQKFLYLTDESTSQTSTTTTTTTSSIITRYNPVMKLSDLESLFSSPRRPFPKDVRLSFHRLGRKCGWTPELIAMWIKTEEFWKYRDEMFLKLEQKASPVKIANFRRKIFTKANKLMQLLNDMAEPMVMWSEGMRIFAVNKAAIAFFGRSAEEMTNAKLGYEDDKEDETWDWKPDKDAEQSDNVFRLFDLVHSDDATSFGCSAAADAMSFYPVDADAARGFRMKVRVNISKKHADQANVVPTLSIARDIPNTDEDRQSSLYNNSDNAICVVTQSYFRDKQGRFEFASCTFVRIDDIVN